jgi:lipopolysaccharide export system protein LptA
MMRIWFIHKLPRLVRALAVVLFVAIGAALVISYKSQQRTVRRTGETFPEIRFSQRMVSVTQGIRHLQTQGDRRLFLLTASRDELYDDGHHELKEVALEVYDADNQPQGWVHANTATYDPASGLVIFREGVVATTWDGLMLKTERLVYEQHTAVIRTEQTVTFERKNIKGAAVGAEVHTQRDQEQVILRSSVEVQIEQSRTASNSPRSQPIQIRCDAASYRKSDPILHLLGNVSFSQAEQRLTAQRMDAFFDDQNRLQRVEAHGQTVLQSNSERRSSEVRADEMQFSFDGDQRLRLALALGNAAAQVREPHQLRDVRAPRIEAHFASSNQSAAVYVSRLASSGRVDVRFKPLEIENAAQVDNWRYSSEEKTLTANSVELFYREGGRALDRAIAAGEAVLVLVPRQVRREAERKTIHAERMDIEFYDDGNLAKTLTAHGRVRVEFTPLVPAAGRPSRTTTSQELTAQIDRLTQEFSQLIQSGDFQFTESDRRAASQRATYDAASHVIGLRGGEPVIWDSRGRTRAKEIDINMETDESFGRGQVTTTYYNRQSTGGAVPFEKAGAPIFLAADRIEVKHRPGLAVYSGRARAWQEDNYVAADRIELHQAEKMMVAIGQVQTAFYQPPEPAADRSRPTAPVFVSAQRMTYLDPERLVRYENEARLRWNGQQLSADVVTVFLKSEANEIDRAVADGRVFIAEPGRRAYGDQAVYTAADDRVVLTGQPARVEDERHQVTQRGSRLTFLRGSDKVFVGEQASSQRVKSVRKIQ